MITLEWDLHRQLAMFSGVGQVSLADIGTALRDAMATEAYSETNASIWMLVDAELDVTQAELYELLPAIEALAAAAPEGRKLAWVVEFELHKAIINMVYKDYEWITEWRVFHSLDDALAWCEPEG